MSEITSYPLCWPAGWKRTPANERKRAQFGTTTNQDGSWKGKRELTIAEGIKRVFDELRQLHVDRDSVIVSTNLRARLDGMPYSKAAGAVDPGVALYWLEALPEGVVSVRPQEYKCMAIDRYDRVADNLGAIAATMGAMRAIERHGGAAILERAFIGFTALPPPEQKDWWRVLGFERRGDVMSLEMAEDAYRRLAKKYHPDLPGGDAGKFAEISAAIAEARQA